MKIIAMVFSPLFYQFPGAYGNLITGSRNGSIQGYKTIIVWTIKRGFQLFQFILRRHVSFIAFYLAGNFIAAFIPNPRKIIADAHERAIIDNGIESGMRFKRRP